MTETPEEQTKENMILITSQLQKDYHRLQNEAKYREEQE